jgi:predicted  nucleic acid-binding Zn-ribbon protein
MQGGCIAINILELELAISLENQCTAQAEVERLRERLAKAEELIRGLHDGWKKARKAHLETCKNTQSEIDKLHTENICLQELIQEFYEWSRRDYPTEAEVREIMDRYHDLLNK